MSYGIIGFLVGIAIVYISIWIVGLFVFIETIERFIRLKYNEEIARATTIISLGTGVILICTAHGYILELIKLVLLS